MNEPKPTNGKPEDPLLAEIDELMDVVEEETEEKPSEDSSNEKAGAPAEEKIEDSDAEEKEEEPDKEEKVDEDEKEEVSDEESNDDDDDVLAQLNALAKENRALRSGTFKRDEATKPAIKEEKETPVKDEPTTTQPVVETPKGKLLFDNQEQYEKALGSYEDFNKVLLQNQSAVFEMVAQKLIPVIGRMIADYIRNDRTVEKFYSEQNDLAPVKDLVELEADKIRAKEPNLDTETVLKKAGESARKIVGGYLKKSGKASVKSAKPRLITPNSRASRPKKTVSPDPNSQEALMSDLL